MSNTLNGMQVIVLCLNMGIFIYAIFANLKIKLRDIDKTIILFIALISIFTSFGLIKHAFSAQDTTRISTVNGFLIAIIHFYIICSFVKKRNRRKGNR